MTGRIAERMRRAGPLALAAVALVLMVGFVVGLGRLSANEARLMPAPAIDETSANETAANETAGATEAVAVLAGGCFWGVQGVFQHVDGVRAAVSGYAGGTRETARYALVSIGATTHAEAVRITYDPRKVTYGRLLQIFFSVVHDPTQVDRQGPDVGAHYRSAIFPESDEQARIAQAYIAQLTAARAYSAPIATRIERGHPFHAAEDYHQDFMTRNPRHPYIVHHDLPKVADLKRLFPAIYRTEPALVFASSRTH